MGGVICRTKIRKKKNSVIERSPDEKTEYLHCNFYLMKQGMIRLSPLQFQPVQVKIIVRKQTKNLKGKYLSAQIQTSAAPIARRFA